jgi:hypothetical protein
MEIDMAKNETDETKALAAAMERQDKELAACRERLAALEATWKELMDVAGDQVAAVIKALAERPARKEGEDVGKGAVVLYHAPDGDWPALLVSAKVVRAGFPLRYLLYVFFARSPRYVYDVTEGRGPEQFSV